MDEQTRSNIDRIDGVIARLTGKAHAQNALFFALIKTHPDRAALLCEIEAQAQRHQAVIEANAVDETMLDAFRENMETFAALARRPALGG